MNFGVYLLLKDLLLTGVLGMDTSAWTAIHASIFVTIFAATQALFNHFGIKVTTMLTDFSGYLIFVIAVLLDDHDDRLGCKLRPVPPHHLRQQHGRSRRQSSFPNRAHGWSHS